MASDIFCHVLAGRRGDGGSLLYKTYREIYYDILCNSKADIFCSGVTIKINEIIYLMPCASIWQSLHSAALQELLFVSLLLFCKVYLFCLLVCKFVCLTVYSITPKTTTQIIMKFLGSIGTVTRRN